MFLNPEKDVRINLYEWQRWQILTFQVTLTKGGGLCWVLQSTHKIQTILDRIQSGQDDRDADKHELKNLALPSPSLLTTVAAKHLALPTAERSHEPWFPRCLSQPLTNKRIIIHPLHRGRGKNMPSLDQEYTLEGNLSSLSFPWTACCQQYCKILITIMISYTVSKRGFIHMKSSSRLMPVLLHVLYL